ncbi:hypothetical protein BDZ97DRAFT_1758990 [Flammula alnicola]|nr:hypothetical protein BDZ97DRAFT_1758990 [Flammula alnicola]
MTGDWKFFLIVCSDFAKQTGTWRESGNSLSLPLMPTATTKKVLTAYFNVRKTLMYTKGYRLEARIHNVVGGWDSQCVLVPALKTRVPQSHALKLYQYTQANPAAPHSRFQLHFNLKPYFEFRKTLLGCGFSFREMLLEGRFGIPGILGFLGYICAMWFSRVISAVTLKMVQWGFVFSSTRTSQCGSGES